MTAAVLAIEGRTAATSGCPYVNVIVKPLLRWVLLSDIVRVGDVDDLYARWMAWMVIHYTEWRCLHIAPGHHCGQGQLEDEERLLALDNPGGTCEMSQHRVCTACILDRTLS